MSTEKLPKNGFLSEASDALADMLDDVSTETQLNPGDILFEQGDEARELYALCPAC